MITVIEVVLSIILGTVFLGSAIPKLRHPRGFVLTVLEYRVLPLTLSRFYGWILPPLELLLALLVLSGTSVRLAAIVISLLLFSFIVAVGINMARGRELDCGCFGTKKRRKIGWELLLQDGALLGSATTLTILASTWVGFESWSVFRLFGMGSIRNPFPFLICVGLTVSVTALLRKSLVERKRSLRVLTRG